ncbi:PAS domain-containing protein [Piscinibacter koreensis]|uniref:histidine kinase n=1 Tax=Piscinibacter koreensis TaxID=2742824 RepID=A0A7Y6NPZ3_9BURK|nr:PAS domain-containing protein [Schlegelella koreensis]NUZ07170.1 PAS domain-containing protein [Schlegelella koreensis]
MTVPASPPPTDALDAMPAAVWRALAEQSRELLAISDAERRLLWGNAAFVACLALRPGDRWPPRVAAADGSPLDDAVEAGLAGGRLGPIELDLPCPSPGTCTVRAEARRIGRFFVWTLQDLTESRRASAQLRRQNELLEMAREFGRIGIWERDIATGSGRWDRQVFAFWGLDPEHGTPSYDEAVQRIHPDDQVRMSYPASMRSPGRYAQRYRVVHPDGSTRWIHSQWEVQKSPDGTPGRAVGIMMDDTEAYEAARTLHAVNAQLEMAVDLGNIAVWRQDLRTQVAHCNAAAFGLLGYAPRGDGVPVGRARALVHPADLPAVEASARRALRTNRPSDVEARYCHADGSWRYLLTRRVVQRGPSNEPLAFVGVSLDVTDRVLPLRTAQDLARRLDAAATAARLGIWTLTVGGGAEWNAQMFELFDVDPRAGTPTVHAWLESCVDPRDRARVARLALEYIHHGSGRYEIEFRTRRRDGSKRWMVVRADVDPEPGGTRRLLGVALDVTEQRQMLEALRDASERSALITRHAGIGTWETDAAGGHERWDDQMFHLRGLSPHDTVPSPAERLALVHPDDRSRALEERNRAVGSGQPGAYEFRVRWPDGSYRWLASRSAPLLDADGRVLRQVGVNWDITESRNAELARAQAAIAERDMQAKSQFLSRMSHELRTALNAVLGFTQLLQIEAERDGMQSQLDKLAHIRAAGDHLLSLINDVLELSGIESGDVRLAPRRVEIATLVGEALPLVAPMADRQRVTLGTGRLDGVVHADPTRLRQVLLNLLSNAIKYNRAGGRVDVESTAAGERMRLAVTDTGRGLAASQLEHLFEPFNRFGAEREGIEGTGIGLTIVKTLVEGMGGSIAVTSTPGLGSRFELDLPATARLDDRGEAGAPPGTAHPTSPEGAARQRDTVQPFAAGAAPTRHARLLYIEDNAVNVLLVEELVRSIGSLSIEAASTGAEGVERARSLRPDLILVDLQLPDFDGYEVLRRLRADPATRDIPCVALSANAMPEDIEHGLEAGFCEYWTKPIDFGVFIAALERRFPPETSQAG